MGRKLQFFVAGLGRFGESAAVTLEKMGYDVMAMDIAEDVVHIGVCSVCRLFRREEPDCYWSG